MSYMHSYLFVLWVTVMSSIFVWSSSINGMDLITIQPRHKEMVSTLDTTKTYRCKIPFKRHLNHNDVIKWKHFPRYWPFVRGIHWSPVNSPYKGQWRRALIFSLICAWIQLLCFNYIFTLDLTPGFNGLVKLHDEKRNRFLHTHLTVTFWKLLLFQNYSDQCLKSLAFGILCVLYWRYDDIYI